ncbi:MAG: zf-HC2 domain-containing protein [Candidatus Omnitrophica bacterium]|nr:zf-HC2 domain-containing protein [Candidatus Omnitrophota bacterium]
MTSTKLDTKAHPTDVQLADYLGHALSGDEKARLESHIASCGECLGKVASAYGSVNMSEKKSSSKKGVANMIKKLNIYLILAIASFALSFLMPRYFLQFLVATLLLGIKWVVDSKTSKMLIMIHEAWKKGGEKEASRILQSIDPKNRL